MNDFCKPYTYLTSLDIFRGMTVALMILVNSPGNASPYTWLKHASWNGCTVADVVFPFFIVIVGISAVLALSNGLTARKDRSQLIKTVLWRSGYIFLIGLLLNALPHALPLEWDFSSLRILGVLQRIALCYFIVSVLYLTTQPRMQIILFIIILLVYGWVILPMRPLTLNENIVGIVDQWVLLSGHLYTPTFDPEGLLSTLPAIASALIGSCLGLWLISAYTKPQKWLGMVAMGLLLLSLGWAWQYSVPFNKALWTSSYVLWTGGLAILFYSCLYAGVEIQQMKRGLSPFQLLGRHALLVYVLHVVFLKIQALIHVHNAAGTWVNARVYITETVFGFLSSENAALCYAVSYLLVWIFVVIGLEEYKSRDHGDCNYG